VHTYLDGNALAGPLGEVFAVDLTTAVGQCASCGARAVLAQAHVYMDNPGAVARCPTCGQVLLRLARAEGRAWLDLRGVSSLELSMPGE
jgi:predicted RNA-binding Zn-ribbon protein involved in translation (DUF1610 family)